MEAPDPNPKRAKIEADQHRMLQACGFDESGSRHGETVVWQAQFVRCTGSTEAPMNKEMFTADAVQRGFEPEWAAATFRGVDIDNSGAINLHEYILGRAALAYEPHRDNGTPLVQIRLRIAFYFYDHVLPCEMSYPVKCVIIVAIPLMLQLFATDQTLPLSMAI